MKFLGPMIMIKNYIMSVIIIIILKLTYDTIFTIPEPQTPSDIELCGCDANYHDDINS